MTRQEALNRLNLYEGFSESELKRAHRKLVKKYHPDINSNNIEECNEKTKEINIAYDILSGVRESDRDERSANMNLMSYKRALIDKIEIMIKESPVNQLSTKFISIFFDFRLAMISALEKEACDMIFENTKEKIINVYRRFKMDTYEYYELDDSMVSEEINYEVPFKEFYEQLEIIKERYSKKYQLEKRLDNEIKEYEDYTTYNDVISKHIERIKYDYLRKAKEFGYTNIEDLISKMHEEIVELLLKIDETAEKIEILNQDVNEVDDYLLSIMYMNLKEAYNNGTSLEDLNIRINDIEEKMQGIKSEKNLNLEAIPDVYDYLLKISQPMSSIFNGTKRHL